MAKFVCTVCGYVYEGEAAPAECPICHAPAEKFVKQEGEMTWASEHVVGVAKGVSEDILADLRANFEGECSEVGMYLAMARVAHREGYPEIGMYYEKAAYEEAEHAAKFAELLGEVVTDSTKKTFRFTREFANMVQAYFPAGTGTVTVAGALDKISTTTSVTGYCYEDGCTFTAADGNGYAFDGWYADQAYTQLLSAAAAYKHAPTKVKTAIYARFALVKQPKVEISCNQQNKNSTYMYNKNTVTMTVTDYSGPVTIKATCAAGGLFTSTTSFSKTVVSGQSFTLDPIVFVPTAVGDVSYTIDVATSTGIKIGAKTVTNNIVATKLTYTN